MRQLIARLAGIVHSTYLKWRLLPKMASLAKISLSPKIASLAQSAALSELLLSLCDTQAGTS